MLVYQRVPVCIFFGLIVNHSQLSQLSQLVQGASKIENMICV